MFNSDDFFALLILILGFSAGYYQKTHFVRGLIFLLIGWSMGHIIKFLTRITIQFLKEKINVKRSQ